MFDFMKKQDINSGVADFAGTDGAVLLDVRTSDEYRQGHVPKSRNIDLAELHGVSKIITDKSTPIFVYCYSGARSGKAVNMLRSIGYAAVKNIGGISTYTGAIERGV